jgi:hypothetical protein
VVLWLRKVLWLRDELGLWHVLLWLRWELLLAVLLLRWRRGLLRTGLGWGCKTLSDGPLGTLQGDRGEV